MSKVLMNEDTSVPISQCYDSEMESVKSLLVKISNSWEKRSQVRKNSKVDNLVVFDKEADDFLEELLPFKHHYLYQSSSPQVKKQILSCGWLIYNQKTFSIETKIITPACVHILFDEVPGFSDLVSKMIISETMVDESYHTLLVSNAIRLTSQYRMLSLVFPKFNLCRQMSLCQESYTEKWRKVLVQLATSIVSEIFISDYLKLISASSEIQPFNQLVTSIHRKDELAHAGIFKLLTKIIVSGLSKK